MAGLVIANNYDKSIEKLSKDLNLDIEVLEEVCFEEASSNWAPEGEFNVYFSNKATMVFFSHGWVFRQYASKTAATLNYAYSATAMLFQCDYFKDGQLVRSITEHEGDRKMEEGAPLAIEKDNPTADGLIFALIDQLLDDNFGGIDLGEKSFRCKIK